MEWMIMERVVEEKGKKERRKRGVLKLLMLTILLGVSHLVSC